MLHFMVVGLIGCWDDRFFRSRAAFRWEKRLAEMQLGTYPHLKRGKRWAVVTGSNSGIGYQVALLLARCGVSVVLACRSDARGAEAERSIRETLGEEAGVGRVEYVRLDVADLGSVTQFARLMEGRGVALLVCNAGAMCLPWSLTPQGFETVFGTHVMGHALLAQLLLPELLRCSKGTARIVYSASRTVEKGILLKECFGRPEQPLKGFDKYSHYANVKMTQTTCALALADELGAGEVAVHAVHPGCVQSNIIKNAALLGSLSGFFEWANQFIGHISPLEGASYVVRACLHNDCAPAAGTGRYLHCGQPCIPGPLASDPQLRKQAWTLLQQALCEGGWLKLDQ